MDYSDQQLIANYLAGDEKSLEILFSRYLKPVYSFVYRYLGNSQKTETEDVTQEIFIKVWRHLKKFDRNKNFKTWIFSIAKNSCLDFLKKKKTISFSELENKKEQNDIAETFIDPTPLPLELSEKNEIAQKIQKALNKLSPSYRTVLSLYYNNHLALREIAESFDEPLNTIKSRHRRGLMMLKKILDGEK